MAKPILLHPKIRVREQARVSASALAEFIIVTPDRQDDVLHDARFMRSMPAAAYSDAIRAIKAYCSDPYRDASVFTAAVAALTKKSKTDLVTPSQREEALRCIEVIERFQNTGNFGARKLPLIAPERFEPLTISGITVSVQPDLIVSTAFPGTAEKIGLVFLRPQKRPDPEDCQRDETRSLRIEHRREAAKYMLVLGHMLLRESGIAETRIDTKKMAIWDLRLREAIEFPSDRKARERRINAACGQIRRLWDTVEPQPGDYAKPA